MTNRWLGGSGNRNEIAIRETEFNVNLMIYYLVFYFDVVLGVAHL
jgi:hypothetical protein